MALSVPLNLLRSVTRLHTLLPLTVTLGIGTATTIFWVHHAKHALDPENPESGFTFGSLLRLLYASLRSKRLRNFAVIAGCIYIVLRKSGFTKRGPAAAIIAGMYAVFYYNQVREVSKVFYSKTFFNRYLVRNSKLARIYSPTFWMTNAHAMTLLGTIARDLEFLIGITPMTIKPDPNPPRSYDGVNTVQLDWYESSIVEHRQHNVPTSDDDSAIVVVAHGLGGNSTVSYLKTFGKRCANHGWRCVSYDYWRLDFAEWRDLDIAIEHIHKNNPKAPIILVGFSAGSNVVLRYLQSVGKDTPVVASIVVSAVMDLMVEYQQIKAECETDRINVAYKKFVDTTVHRMALRMMEHDQRADLNRELIIKTLKEEQDGDWIYDRVVAASPNHSEYPCRFVPKHRAHTDTAKAETEAYVERKKSAVYPTSKEFTGTGVEFLLPENAAHYKGVSQDKLDLIEVPLLMIHAEDDPLIRFHTKGFAKAAQSNRNIICVTTRRGGHVSWQQGVWPFGSTWDAEVILDYISSVLEIQAEVHFTSSIVLSKLGHAPRASQKDLLRRVTSTGDVSDVK